MSLEPLPVLWIFPGSLSVICYNRWILSEGHKNYFKDYCHMNSKPNFLFLTYFPTELSKGCKSDNFESRSSPKLGFKNNWGLSLNFVECESFLKSDSPDIPALCETNFDDSNDSGNFSVRSYLKGFYYWYALSSSFCDFLGSYLCFWLHSVSYFFLLYCSPSLFLCMVFDSISSNIDEVLSINPSANVLVFRYFHIYHKDLLTYSCRTGRPVKLGFLPISYFNLYLYLKWPYSVIPCITSVQSCSSEFIPFF